MSDQEHDAYMAAKKAAWDKHDKELAFEYNGQKKFRKQNNRKKVKRRK